MIDAQGRAFATAARRVGIALPFVLLAGFLASGPSRALPSEARVVIPLTGLAIVALGTLAICILASLSTIPAPRRASSMWRSMGVCAVCWLVPATVVVLLRLLVHMCPVVNVLGLPWPPGVRLAVQLVGVAILVIAAVALVTSRRSRELAGTYRVMRITLLIGIAPAFFGYFLLVYGDPGPGCIPG